MLVRPIHQNDPSLKLRMRHSTGLLSIDEAGAWGGPPLWLPRTIAVVPPGCRVTPGLVLEPIWREGRGMRVWRPDEVEEVFCRSGGPGGQHVNKVSTAVTLRHVATGISVRVSTSRSQARNRAEANRLLAAKLEAAAVAARQSHLAEVSKNRRRKAKRSKATKRRLVESKRRRGETKQLRKKVS